ncbi:DUF1120 domain-containing protein [Atlantibacter subterraneus]|uniref:DUF1120 domain-containing protein n=1 Tax=Atlantibacter subterraneus TaxID=255519 RepID=UPI0028984D79|nr:DUF1120 domain-containing protein [Atlantibacter subterranea]
MLKRIFLLFIAFMATISTANSVDLKVSGKLVDGSCIPTLTNGGVVDFGLIPLGNLSKTLSNRLGQRGATLTITCDTAMSIAWTITDNKSSTRGNDVMVADAFADGSNCTTSKSQFGIGATEQNVNQGAYCVGMDVSNITLDGVKSTVISLDEWNTRAIWQDASSAGALLNGLSGYRRDITIAASGQLTPGAGKVFVYPLIVTAAVLGTNTLAITDTSNLDGLATITMVYL